MKHRFQVWLTPLLFAVAGTLALAQPAETEDGIPAELGDAAAVPPQVAMVELTEDAARYWPRWRGPSGQGFVSGTGYADRWSPQENLLWKVDVPGSDSSSPIIWEDRIFLTTDYPTERRRSILAYRRSDGGRLWETFAPAARGDSVRKGTHAIATPVTDGKRVYAFLGKYGLLAVDLDGKQLWHKSVGPYDHGTSSPLLFDGMLVVVQVLPSGQGSIVLAVDSSSGDTIWEKERAESYASGTPVVIRADGREELLVSGQQQVQAYDPYTGRPLWKARGNAKQAIPTPVVGYGLVFVASGPAGPSMAIHPGGTGNVSDTHVPWRVKQWGAFLPSPIFWEGYLYVVNDMSSVLTCFEAATGRIVWQHQLGKARREGFAASPVAVDGKLFFTNTIGETFVIQPGAEFELVRTNILRESVRASPALAEGRWYFRTTRSLVAIGE